MLRRSPPRLQILDVFRNSPVRHLTADEVYRLLIIKRQPLSMATAYKVLAQFEQAGILQRSDLGQGRHVYELPLEGATDHGHLVCSNGQVTEFPLPEPFKEELSRLAEAQGWTITGLAITAYARPVQGLQTTDSDSAQ